MPTSYTDQALGGNFDPGVPPTLPASVTVVSINLLDADDDGLISANGSDQVNGSNVINVWNGDTITLDGVLITGATFYTADGSRYFTPTDGSILQPGTVSATTFVTVSTSFDVDDFGPPCFTTGTLIETPDGAKAIEDLAVGDLVTTRDNGAQPLRWIGRTKVSGRGKFAPICIAKGVLGNSRDLLVSPQHRMLISDWRAQLFLGRDESFCPAARLVNGDTIYRSPCDEVEYFHLLFDQHEIIYAEEAATESFLPGESQCAKGSRTYNEIAELFPEIEDIATGFDAAVYIARGFESEVVSKSLH